MTTDEIITYVMQSPENTNPTVLRNMLEQLDTGSGSGGSGELADAIVLSLEPYTDGMSGQRWIPGMTKAEIITAVQEGKTVLIKNNSFDIEDIYEYGQFFMNSQYDEPYLDNTNNTVSSYFLYLTTEDGYMLEDIG